MKRKKSAQPPKVFLLAIIFICLVVAMSFGFLLGTKNSGNQKEISTRIDLKSQISFELPEGWKQEEDNENNYLSFISSDYRANPIPAIENGAHISVFRSPKHPNTSLREYITNAIPVPLEDKTDINEKTVGDKKFLNTFLCWEGCSDSYYMENDIYVWEFHFSCAPNCSSRIEMENGKYIQERDIFLNSLKFN